jgi:NAD(P)-dependent dehydrogenase (short-subunit alcohol dehydrogenase family)
MLGEEGHGLTVAARRPEKLADAAQELRDAGYEVEEVPANLTSEEEIQNVVARHRERFRRLDVLVNNAGVGIGAPVADHETKRVDMQLDLTLRSIILFYRECADLLRAAGAARGSSRRAVPRLRRDRDDRVHLRSGAGRGDDPHLRRRRGRALRAAREPGVRDPGDHLPAAWRDRLGASFRRRAMISGKARRRR